MTKTSIWLTYADSAFSQGIGSRLHVNLLSKCAAAILVREDEIINECQEDINRFCSACTQLVTHAREMLEDGSGQ